MITHDLALLAHVATTVLVMHRGKVVERGEAKQLMREPQHPYTRRLIGDSMGR
jgi:peptide/nickel transport system ATP-binding protein